MTFIGLAPVLAYMVVCLSRPHEHAEPHPAYPYLRHRARVPGFPWGDDDLIGTPEERAEWRKRKAQQGQEPS